MTIYVSPLEERMNTSDNAPGTRIAVASEPESAAAPVKVWLVDDNEDLPDVAGRAPGSAAGHRLSPSVRLPGCGAERAGEQGRSGRAAPGHPHARSERLGRHPANQIPGPLHSCADVDHLLQR